MENFGTARLAALGLSPAKGAPFIADCTLSPRFGLRAKGSADWFEGVAKRSLPAINRFTTDESGLTCLRLGMNDIILSGPAALVAATEAAWEASAAEANQRCGVNGYRQNTWAHLVISGPEARELMAELTEVDLRDSALPHGGIAQTRLLHVDTVILRSDLDDVPGYEIFFDIATKAFVLESLHHHANGYHFTTAEAPA